MSDLKECPACAMPTGADLPECEVCGYEFPEEPASRGLAAWLFVGLMLLFALPTAWLAGCFR